MDFSSIGHVMRRITDIEDKIGMKRPAGGAAGFESVMAEALAAPGKGARASAEGTAPKADAAEPVPADRAYLGLIREAARKYGVDPGLVSAVAEVESGFSRDAVSPAGAVGVMQLMPETAASLGVNPYDPAQNIDGGTRYLKEMLDAFGGDVRKAVAAYNAGPEAVRGYGGVPPYGETQRYVSSVLDLYR